MCLPNFMVVCLVDGETANRAHWPEGTKVKLTGFMSTFRKLTWLSTHYMYEHVVLKSNVELK